LSLITYVLSCPCNSFSFIFSSFCFFSAAAVAAFAVDLNDLSFEPIESQKEIEAEAKEEAAHFPAQKVDTRGNESGLN